MFNNSIKTSYLYIFVADHQEIYLMVIDHRKIMPAKTIYSTRYAVLMGMIIVRTKHTNVIIWGQT